MSIFKWTSLKKAWTLNIFFLNGLLDSKQALVYAMACIIEDMFNMLNYLNQVLILRYVLFCVKLALELLHHLFEHFVLNNSWVLSSEKISLYGIASFKIYRYDIRILSLCCTTVTISLAL